MQESKLSIRKIDPHDNVLGIYVQMQVVSPILIPLASCCHGSPCVAHTSPCVAHTEQRGLNTWLLYIQSYALPTKTKRQQHCGWNTLPSRNNIMDGTHYLLPTKIERQHLIVFDLFSLIGTSWNNWERLLYTRNFSGIMSHAQVIVITLIVKYFHNLLLLFFDFLSTVFCPRFLLCHNG